MLSEAANVLSSSSVKFRLLKNFINFFSVASAESLLLVSIIYVAGTVIVAAADGFDALPPHSTIETRIVYWWYLRASKLFSNFYNDLPICVRIVEFSESGGKPV